MKNCCFDVPSLMNAPKSGTAAAAAAAESFFGAILAISGCFTQIQDEMFARAIELTTLFEL